MTEIMTDPFTETMTEPFTETIIIETVYLQEQTYPMVVNFQNGYPNEDFEIDAAFLQDENANNTIATELSGLLYAGTEEKEELGKTLILARDRDTGKVRLIEAGCVDLNPVFNIDLDAPQLLETSNLELSRKFGSKKQKQQMEQREKLKVNINTVTEQMEKVTENISADNVDLSAYNKSDSDDFYIPPIDRTATKVEDVYDLTRILTEEEYEIIYSELENKDYTSDFVPWIKTVVTERTNMTPRLTVLAVYANSLLKLCALKATDLRKKMFTACPPSHTLNDYIVNNFTTMSNGKRNRSLQYRDKTICYFIVFMLILTNFKYDLEALTSELKMAPATVALKVRVTGACCVTTGNKKVVQLKLPLITKFSSFRRSAKF